MQTYASPYTSLTPKAFIKSSFDPSKSNATTVFTGQGVQPLRPFANHATTPKNEKCCQNPPDDVHHFADRDSLPKRRKPNPSRQHFNACSGADKDALAEGSRCKQNQIASKSKEETNEGAHKPKESADENEKAYPMSLGGIDSFLTQAKGRYPGPDSDDSDNDDDQTNRPTIEERVLNDELTILPSSSPYLTIGPSKKTVQNTLFQDDHDILAIVDRIIIDLAPPQTFPSGPLRGSPPVNFRGSSEAHRLATELRHQVTMLNPQKNLITSKELGLAMSMFYNHLSSRALICSRTIISPAHVPIAFGMTLPTAAHRMPPVGYQALPAHVYQHVPPPPCFEQAVLPSQPMPSVSRASMRAPSAHGAKADIKVQDYGFQPTPSSSPTPKKKRKRSGK